MALLGPIVLGTTNLFPVAVFHPFLPNTGRIIPRIYRSPPFLSLLLSQALESVLVLTRRLYSDDPCIPNLRSLAISFHYITSSTSGSELPNRAVLCRERWKNIDEAELERERERESARACSFVWINSSPLLSSAQVIDHCRAHTNHTNTDVYTISYISLMLVSKKTRTHRHILTIRHVEIDTNRFLCVNLDATRA